MFERDILIDNLLREGLSFSSAFRANVAQLGSCSCLGPGSAAVTKVNRTREASTTGFIKHTWVSPFPVSREQKHTCGGASSWHPLKRLLCWHCGWGNSFVEKYSCMYGRKLPSSSCTIWSMVVRTLTNCRNTSSMYFTNSEIPIK